MFTLFVWGVGGEGEDVSVAWGGSMGMEKKRHIHVALATNTHAAMWCMFQGQHRRLACAVVGFVSVWFGLCTMCQRTGWVDLAVLHKPQLAGVM